MNTARDPADVGKTLRILRGIRTRTGAAREIGISYSMLCKIEDGLRTPSEELKDRIADYYGKPKDLIFYTQE